MKAKGLPTDINAVPEDEEERNPAIEAIAQLQGVRAFMNPRRMCGGAVCVPVCWYC